MGVPHVSSPPRNTAFQARASVKPLLLAYSPDFTRELMLGRRATDVEACLVHDLPMAETLNPERPVVVLLDRQLVAGVPDLTGRLRELSGMAALVWCGAPGEVAPPSTLPGETIVSFLPHGAPLPTQAALLRGAMRHAVTLRAERLATDRAEARLEEVAELARVGAALATQRDVTQLLDLILSQARRLTQSDAGSLYLVERPEDSTDDASEPTPARLRFMLCQNNTLPRLSFDQFTLPIDSTSLAGHVARTGTLLTIPDVHSVVDDAPYRLNGSYDQRSGYHTRSVLVVPLTTHKHGTVGVLQLINRKRTAAASLPTLAEMDEQVVPYDRTSTELVTALAAQAAVAIENARLYESIERLFEGFVTASVTAIESRDPTTSGHSSRVAQLTVALAETVSEAGGTPGHRDVHFTRQQLRELRYAALLHDFGKVAVREEVLVKARKLYPIDLQRIRHRLAMLLQHEALTYERERADHLLAHGRDGYDDVIAALSSRRHERSAHLERLMRAVEAANAPTVLPEERAEELARLAGCTVEHPGGDLRPLLEDGELRSLQIQRGTLDERERREIEAHVNHTYRFLAQIPWTDELRRVPDIARCHHEKLNGRGYPRGLTADRIPVQVRMMTIVDIYDALTAADRPYKPAVSPEQALDILGREADAGELDRELLNVFIGAGIYRLARTS